MNFAPIDESIQSNLISSYNIQSRSLDIRVFFNNFQSLTLHEMIELEPLHLKIGAMQFSFVFHQNYQ